MREHVLLFCLLGLVLTATSILVIAPGAVTWALAFIELKMRCYFRQSNEHALLRITRHARATDRGC